MTDSRQCASAHSTIPRVQLSPPSRASRAACALAAVAAGGSVLSAVVVGFHLQSPEAWLVNTPEVLAEAAHCERRASRAEREVCRQQLVQAAVAAPAPRPLERVAAR